MTRRDTDHIWLRFKDTTRARIGLGRVGDALPTSRLLEFQAAHATARDAVLAPVDFAALAESLAPLAAALAPLGTGLAPLGAGPAPPATIHVQSAAPTRADYLRRPDLGRRLGAGCAGLLPAGPYDAVFVVADGLSATAVQAHAAPLLGALVPRLEGWRLGPVILAERGRVALGDEIAEAMHAELVVVLIGERPGLSVSNSLGIYLTHAPRVGRRDSERNCISNVHADGLDYSEAADKLEWLMRQARLLQLTGVALKEDAPSSPRLGPSAKRLT